MNDSKGFIGLDTHKKTIAVAIASDGRDGEVRYFGEIANDPVAVEKLSHRLSAKYRELNFCYEAGPCGYGLQRQLAALGHECIVVAPSLIPVKTDRIKNDRRDAVALARLHRAGELTRIWIPDDAHEAIRDLVRARITAMETVRKFRQQLQGFLLRQGRIYPGKTAWTRTHANWIRTLTFAHPAHYAMVHEHLEAIQEGLERQQRLEEKIDQVLPSWSLAPVVNAIQALRGVSWLAAVILASEIGDFQRFTHPRQLMSYLGIVPSESSSGSVCRRGPITKAGSSRARRVLIEGAWAYRLPPRLSKKTTLQHVTQPKAVREIAWKAQLRLCARYRQMQARGKHKNVVVTAIAREMAAFIWAIARMVPVPARQECKAA